MKRVSSALYGQVLQQAQASKQAFVASSDPSMAGAMAPPGGDPSMGGMDPSMMGGAPPAGGAPPMDPMAMGGGMPPAPPPSDPAAGPATPSPDLANRVAMLEQGAGGGKPGMGGKPKLDVGEQLMYLIRQMKTVITFQAKLAETLQIKMDPNEMTASLGPSPEDMMNGQVGIGGAPAGGPAGGAAPAPAPPADPMAAGGGGGMPPAGPMKMAKLHSVGDHVRAYQHFFGKS